MVCSRRRVGDRAHDRRDSGVTVAQIGFSTYMHMHMYMYMLSCNARMLADG